MSEQTASAGLAPHDFWQKIYPPGHFAMPAGGWQGLFPARLPGGGGEIALPIRALPDGSGAVASLIINQASFAVEDALAAAMLEAARGLAPDLVVGMPTLGLGLAAQVARGLGHGRMLPLGVSRKFWYDPALSVPLRSITSPGTRAGGVEKRLYLDPRMQPLLPGRRVLLVDDVISSGASVVAALDLLAMVGVVPVGVVVAMVQGKRWQAALAGRGQMPVKGAIRTPRLRASPQGGWLPESDEGRD